MFLCGCCCFLLLWNRYLSWLFHLIITLSPLPLSAAVTSRSDVQQAETDASKREQKIQVLNGRARPVTATRGSAHSDPPTPQPRVSGAVGRVVPVLVPAHKNDMVFISEYDSMPSTQRHLKMTITAKCTEISNYEFTRYSLLRLLFSNFFVSLCSSDLALCPCWHRGSDPGNCLLRQVSLNTSRHK